MSLLLFVGVVISQRCSISNCLNCKYSSYSSYDGTKYQSCNICEDGYNKVEDNPALYTFKCESQSQSSQSGGFKGFQVVIIVAVLGYIISVAGNCWCSSVANSENEKYRAEYCGGDSEMISTSIMHQGPPNAVLSSAQSYQNQQPNALPPGFSK